MSALDLDAIEARANAAAEGPWRRYETMQADTFVVGPEGLLLGGAISGPTYNRENCEFIAHAREDVPSLIAEVRRLSQRPSWEEVTIAARDIVNEGRGVHLHLLGTDAGHIADAVLALFPEVRS